MKLWFPLFLMVSGLLIIWQPRTSRWQQRISAHLGGDERRIRQRAKTFVVLGVAFILVGFALLVRQL